MQRQMYTTSQKVAAIEELLRAEELWQTELAKKMGMSPQLLRYYLNKYLKDKIEVSVVEGNNMKLKLKTNKN